MPAAGSSSGLGPPVSARSPVMEEADGRQSDISHAATVAGSDENAEEIEEEATSIRSKRRSPAPKPKRKRILKMMGVREFPRGLSAAAPSGRMVEPQAGAVGVMATI